MKMATQRQFGETEYLLPKQSHKNFVKASIDKTKEIESVGYLVRVKFGERERERERGRERIRQLII